MIRTKVKGIIPLRVWAEPTDDPLSSAADRLLSHKKQPLGCAIYRISGQPPKGGDNTKSKTQFCAVYAAGVIVSKPFGHTMVELNYKKG